MKRLALNLDSRPTVILGLEPENVRRMTKGQPIRVNLRHLDPYGPEAPQLPDVDVLICATDTDDWRQAAKKLGLDDE